MSTIFFWFISNIVEIGFARPNAVDIKLGYGRPFSVRPSVRQTSFSLRMHIVTAESGCFLATGRRTGGSHHTRRRRRRFYCVFIAGWSSVAPVMVCTRQISSNDVRRRRSFAVSIIVWRTVQLAGCMPDGTQTLCFEKNLPSYSRQLFIALGNNKLFCFGGVNILL